MPEEHGQAPAERSDKRQSVRRMSDDADTHIGGASVVTRRKQVGKQIMYSL